MSDKSPPEPAKDGSAEDAPGAAAELVQDDRKSTWEAIAARNSTAIPRWNSAGNGEKVSRIK